MYFESPISGHTVAVPGNTAAGWRCVTAVLESLTNHNGRLFELVLARWSEVPACRRALQIFTLVLRLQDRASVETNSLATRDGRSLVWWL